MSAPVSRTLSGSIAFTVAAVPTGMNAGVRMSPRGVETTPVRAWPSRAEMAKSNSKLCVILEPLEYAANSTVQFFDDAFGETKKWRSDSIFLMTKYDKQIESTRSANNANEFFKDYLANGIVPHLVITPTLKNENLNKPEELYRQRKKNLLNAVKVSSFNASNVDSCVSFC